MGIYEGAKAVADLARSYDKIDLYQKAVDLMALASDLANENFDLKQQVQTLRKQQTIRDSLVFINNYYWQKMTRDIIDGPFCSCCWDAKSILVRPLTVPSGMGVIFQCPNCKTESNFPSKQEVAKLIAMQESEI